MRQRSNKIEETQMAVEVCKTLFTRQKNNANHVFSNSGFLKNAVEKTVNAFQSVLDCKAEIFLVAIHESIENGSIIYFDCWKAYKTDELEETDFELCKVNHRSNY